MMLTNCLRQAMMHACIPAAALAVTLTVSTPALSQSIEMLAAGVEWYHASKSRCYYSEGVPSIIDQLDANMRIQSPYRWDVLRKKSVAGIPIAVNERKLWMQVGTEPALSEDQLFCDAVSLPVGAAVAIGSLVAGIDAPGAEDGKRLSNGKGRVLGQAE